MITLMDVDILSMLHKRLQEVAAIKAVEKKLSIIPTQVDYNIVCLLHYRFTYM